MQAVASFQSFDGGDLLACGRTRAHLTGAHRLTLNQDRTSTTLTLTTSVLGARKIEAVPQNREQTFIRWSVDAMFGPVYEQGKSHAVPSKRIGVFRKLYLSPASVAPRYYVRPRTLANSPDKPASN
jgi:hypothetical protein